MCGFLVYTGNPKSVPELEVEFKKIRHRGPDETRIEKTPDWAFAFHRLAIMDLTTSGSQPFLCPVTGNVLVCNGEVYNFRKIRSDFETSYPFHSQSDCEVILPLYQKFGIEATARMLDAEYAFVLFDKAKNEVVAARDPIGIRPMFYGYSKTENKIMFASEAKALHQFCKTVEQFPPGHYYAKGKFVSYRQIWKGAAPHGHKLPEVYKNIKELLTQAVVKRLDSDAPQGFLLSGGLDSSLVCSIAAKHMKKPIRTYSVGIEDDPIDTKYARIVADYLKADHTEVLFTKKQVVENLKHLVYLLETWDITTIRASMGMYLVCKYVRENSNIKVVHTGEVSDELFGYKYTDFAPSALAFQTEAEKRIRELYLYDVLRADRSISSNSLEARVPFGDLAFVEYVMNIDPTLKMNTYGHGKFILREAFNDGKHLPDEILFRQKAAFSDAVGHSHVETLKKLAESSYSDQDLANAKKKYPHGTPFTKESLLYRDLFEEHFPGRAALIPDFWMPNKEWENCNVSDPSARVLPNYGASGQ